MKKFLVVLLAIFFSSISLAHIGHYNKFDKIEMEILRNNEVIGYNNYFFERDGETTTVKNQYKFEVKLLSATIFKVEGYGEEIYLNDRLISFQSKTLQNKKEKFVSLKLDQIAKKTTKTNVASSIKFQSTMKKVERLDKGIKALEKENIELGKKILESKQAEEEKVKFLLENDDEKDEIGRAHV